MSLLGHADAETGKSVTVKDYPVHLMVRLFIAESLDSMEISVWGKIREYDCKTPDARYNSFNFAQSILCFKIRKLK